jgi:hypothetical protein
MKPYKFITITIAALMFLALSFKTSSVKVAEATAPSPTWWVDNNNNFSQYDTYQFNNGRIHQATPYPGYGTDSNIISTNASYDGVAAIGPTGTTGGSIDTFFTSDAQASDELEWQCPELVKRFLYLEYGVRSIPAYGYQVVDNYVNPTLGYPNQFYKVPNDGTAKLYPKPGDVLSYGTSSPGHTALVQSVTGESSGSATVVLLEQNASSTGLTYQDFNNWQFQNGVDNSSSDSRTVTGWLTPLKWTNNSPSGTTHDYIEGMAASSTSNIWAAGYELPAGINNQTVTYFNNGSGWTKYSPPSWGNYTTQRLYGIASSSSGDTWTVGEKDLTAPQTYAFHWNQSTHTWSNVTSDNPGGYSNANYLRSVGIDGNGNVFAVGNYSSSTYDLPLLEKYVTSPTAKFANQTLSLPSGASTGELYSVAFSSATKGWAVGLATGPNSLNT